MGASFGISNVQLSHSAVHGGIGTATRGPVDIVELGQRNDASRREIITGEFSQVVAMTIPGGGEIGQEVRRSLRSRVSATMLRHAVMLSTRCLVVNLVVRSAA
jgi:hypothetical protein